MTDLRKLFHTGQPVRCRMDGVFWKGTVTKVEVDHILVDIPEISDHCRFEEGFNISDVFPEYNFSGSEV